MISANMFRFGYDGLIGVGGRLGLAFRWGGTAVVRNYVWVGDISGEPPNAAL